MNVPLPLAVRVVDLEVVAPRASADHLERVGPVQRGPELEFQRVPRLTALFVDGTRDLAVLRPGERRIAEAEAAWIGQEQMGDNVLARSGLTPRVHREVGLVGLLGDPARRVRRAGVRGAER